MIVELRQYTLHPGRRDDLVELFDSEFVTGQEAAGIAVIGQFRDLDHPDRFVWWRAFADMPSRAEALGRFYGGPVWTEHRDRANATMIDSDDVLLLRPLPGTAGFPAPDPAAPPVSLLVTIAAEPLAGTPGSLASFRTEHAENTFPALPVRTGEDLFVRVDRLGDEPAARGRLRLAPTAGSRLRLPGQRQPG